MLVWKLRSFAKHHPIDGSQEGIGFHGSEGSLRSMGNGTKLVKRSTIRTEKPVPLTQKSVQDSETVHRQRSVENRTRRLRSEAVSPGHLDAQRGRLPPESC